MVNKNSPWYIEDWNKIDSIPIPKNKNSLIFKFNNEEDLEYFKTRNKKLVSEYEKQKDDYSPLFGGKSPMKMHYYDQIILDYREDLDSIVIESAIPNGFFRVIKENNTNFIEMPLKEENALLLKKSKVY